MRKRYPYQMAEFSRQNLHEHGFCFSRKAAASFACETSSTPYKISAIVMVVRESLSDFCRFTIQPNTFGKGDDATRSETTFVSRMVTLASPDAGIANGNAGRDF
jgi:hypothetical protein